MTELRIVVPGEPVAQGRPRAVRFGSSARLYDPAKSRAWKGVAQVHIVEAMRAAGLPELAFTGPVELHVVAVWSCPKGRMRKTPVPRAWKASRPDADNVGKAFMDSANGVIFADDSQVVRLVVEKHVAAQGEAPRVEVTVREVMPA